MPRPLPPHSQACDRQADALARDLDAVGSLQIPPQECRGPGRGAIARLAGVLVDDPQNKRVVQEAVQAFTRVFAPWSKPDVTDAEKNKRLPTNYHE